MWEKVYIWEIKQLNFQANLKIGTNQQKWLSKNAENMNGWMLSDSAPILNFWSTIHYPFCSWEELAPVALYLPNCIIMPLHLQSNPLASEHLAQDLVHPEDIRHYLLVQVEAKEKRVVNYL